MATTAAVGLAKVGAACISQSNTGETQSGVSEGSLVKLSYGCSRMNFRRPQTTVRSSKRSSPVVMSLTLPRETADAVLAKRPPVSPEERAAAQKATAKYFEQDTRPIILFDGVCNLCNESVNFVLDHDLEGKMRFAALQSEAGKQLLLRSGRRADDISSIVLVEKDRCYIQSDAVVRIAAKLNGAWPVLSTFGFALPKPLRDVLYEVVADNRYKILGHRNACRLGDPRFNERFLQD